MFLDENNYKDTIKDLTSRLGTQLVVIDVLCKSNMNLEKLIEVMKKQLVEYEDKIAEYRELSWSYQAEFRN